MQHLNLVLRAIRNVNQLITREKDHDRLLQGACDTLVETRGYHNAWVVLLDEKGELVTAAEAGLGKDFSPVVEQLKHGELTECGRRALAQPGVAVTEDPLSTCADCPLSDQYGGRGAMTVRLETGGKAYGLLYASIPADLTEHKEEQALFGEVAGDIGFALHSIELEEEHRRAEKALREAEARYRGLFDGVPIGLYRTTPTGEILDSNPALVHILGYPDRETLLATNAADVYLDIEDRQRWQTLLEREGVVRDFEAQFRQRNGTVIWARDTSRAVRDADGRVLYYEGSLEDITERKRAEEALQYRVEFERLITGISSRFINLTPDEVDSGINRALQAIGEFADVDRSYVFLFYDNGTKVDNTHEWCAEGIEPQIQNLKGILVDDELPWFAERIKKFEVFYVPCVADLPLEASTEKEHFQMQDIRSTIVVPMVYGGSLIGFLGFDSVRVEKTWSEDVIALLRIVGDVIANALEHKRAEEALQEYTERLEEMVEERTQELREAQEQLVSREKLAVLGQLAGGVGHELRNPLGAIKNAAYFLNMVLEKPQPDVKETLEILNQEVATSEKIISSLLGFARTRPPMRRKVDLNDVVRAALAHTAVPEDVEVVSQLDEALPVILADPDQLVQVCGNIILNGVQAMPPLSSPPRAGGTKRGRLVVKTLVSSVEPSEVAGDWVAVSFTDTGVGIAEENLEKIFEPLFTTKAKGIGLGLPLVKTLVEANGGSIEVESEVGQGSTFTVRLPTDGPNKTVTV